MKDDCKTPFTDPNIKISSTSPYAISAVNQVILGYQAKLCLSCSVGQVLDGKTLSNSQTVTSKFTVTQQSKCMTTFSVNPAAPTSLKIDHDLTSYKGVIVD